MSERITNAALARMVEEATAALLAAKAESERVRAENEALRAKLASPGPLIAHVQAPKLLCEGPQCWDPPATNKEKASRDVRFGLYLAGKVIANRDGSVTVGRDYACSGTGHAHHTAAEREARIAELMRFEWRQVGTRFVGVPMK